MSPGRIRHPLAWFWIYTALRVAVFGVIFALLWLSGVRGLLGAALALGLSVPLSYVLLARPRAALAAALHERLVQREERTQALDAELAGHSDEAARPGPADGTGDFPTP